MRRTSIIAAAFGGLVVASSSFAGFTVTAAAPVTASGFDRYDITAVNTGGDTGTQIKGLEYFYAGAPAAFQVDDTTDPVGGDPDGIADTVNLLSTSRTRIRVSTTGANNVFVGVQPDNSAVQPNPYAAGAAAFQGAIANTGTTQASGAGFQIARIFIPTGTSGVFSGNLGGDIGSKVPFSVNLVSGVVVNTAPVITPANQTVNVVFGAIVSSGAPFSATVSITDAETAFTTAVGTLPAGVSGVTITPAGGNNFTIAGTVDYSVNLTDVVVPFSATDAGSPALTSNGSITLHVTPEPASLSLIGLSSMLMGRRRK